jgi:glycerol uptake facilitator-like aquaporin
MVYATGHLSGAHTNPAVTLAFTISRHFRAGDEPGRVHPQVVEAMRELGIELADRKPTSTGTCGTRRS